MLLTKQSKHQPRSIRTRLARRVFLLFLSTFALLGVINMVNQVAGDLYELRVEQRVIVDNLSDDLTRSLDTLRGSVLQIAGSSSARDFALVYQQAGAVEATSAAQERLLGEFVTLAQQQSDLFIELRFITLDGTVAARVVNRNTPEIDRALYAGHMADSPTFQATLNRAPGEVTISSVDFLTGMTGEIITPLRPILRYTTSVPAPADPGAAIGVIEVDINAAAVVAPIDNPAASSPPRDGRELLLVNRWGQTLASSATPQETYLQGGDLGLSADFAADYPAIADRMADSTSPASLVMAGDSLFSSATVSLANSLGQPWQVILVDRLTATLLPSLASATAVLLLSLVVGAGLGLVAARLIERRLQPLEGVDALAADLIAPDGQRSISHIPDAADAADEIGRLQLAFHQLAGRIDTLNHEMEQQVSEYTRNLEIAARISRETATLRNVDELLNHAIDLIVAEYDVYHAQVFLVDDVGINANLVYSHGEVGAQMLAQRHYLPVGSASVVGQATATGQTYLVNDTTSPAQNLHRPNPLLPDTRAEMAVPLRIEDDVLGALDLQSTAPNIFTDELRRAFELLADQIAIAIYKARLLTESDMRLEQIDQLNRQLTGSIWDRASQELDLEGEYAFGRPAAMTAAAEPLQTSIRLRGQEIGVIAAAAPTADGFSQSDRIVLDAVAERVAMAIENARLFQETQASLAQTTVLYQISRYLNESDTLEDIVQAIIVSVMPDAIGGQVGVFDEYSPDEETPEWIEITADWAKVERVDQQVGLPGIQLQLEDYPILQQMRADQVLLISDVARDERLDDVLRAVFMGISAGAVIFIPFSVRGVWRGIIMIEFPQAREFSEREGRIYSTLIDQAGVAIENRLLLRQTEMALSQIERLYSASRIINTSQNMEDLVRAALTTTGDLTLNFELGLLEGALDETGWPTRLHVVARSRKGVPAPDDTYYDVYISTDSPLRYREPQIVLDRNPDDSDVPTMMQFVRRRGNRFGAIFPLFSANQPIALFIITSTEPHELSTDDYEVYRALTGQMSTVLQNRQLLEQTREALDETRLLYAASREIVSAPDVATVFMTATDHLTRDEGRISRMSVLVTRPTPTADAPLIEYRHIWRRDPASTGTPDGDIVPREQAPFAIITARADGTAVFNNLNHELPAATPERTALQRDGAQSGLVTEMRSGQKLLGFLLIESDATNAFTESYVRFARAVANQVAVAVDNHLLFAAAQQEAQRALALAEAGQLASRITGSFESSIETVLVQVAQPAEYTHWLLMLLDEDEQVLGAVVQHMPTLGGDGYTTLDVNTSVHSIVDAVNHDRTILINEPKTYPAFTRATNRVVEAVGKHIATPVRIGGRVVGALLIGRDLDQPDLVERDEQLVTTLAAQIGVALENQRLFQSAEAERLTLRSILDTLPAGVLVLDAESYTPLQFNERAAELLGRPLAPDQPFDITYYNIYRTGTNIAYPAHELPIFAPRLTSHQVDDVTIVHPDGTQIDLLVTAAPIFDRSGERSAIVAAFTDISNLRSLENTLQESLHNTIALYNATRKLAEAEEPDNVLDIITRELESLSPTEGYVLLLDERGGGVQVERSVSSMATTFALPDEMLDPRRVITLGDVAHSDELTEPQRMQLIDYNVRALVSMPLRARGRRDIPLGWIVITYDQPTRLTPEDERFLTTLSDSAAVAFDNRYLLKSTELALQETASLYDATTSISRSRDLAELGLALQSSLATMMPDVYAAYLFGDAGSVPVAGEIFASTTDDITPSDLQRLIERHATRLEMNLYMDSIHAIAAPTPLEEAILGLGGIQAFALVNLRVKGVSKGCLFIGYSSPRRFTDSEARYLGTVADSASVIIDNITLFEQIEKSLEETSLLYQASRALSDATTASDILDVVVRHLIDDDALVVFLGLLRGSQDWASPDAFLRIDASWRRDADAAADLLGQTLSADEMPAWRLLASAEIVMIGDVNSDTRLIEAERRSITDYGLRSLSVIPLRTSRQFMGSILIGSDIVRHFSDRDRRVLQSFSEQASLKIEAARLLEQTERRANQLATSAEVSRFASTILNLDELLPRIVDLIRDAFGYDHTQVFLMDDNDDYAVLRASTGEAGQKLLGIGHKLQKGSQSVIGQVTANMTHAIALDTADADVVHYANPYLPDTRSEMAVPLVIKGKVVGALDVQSNQPNAFDSDDVAVLTTLAGQISVAIDNARLFQESRQRANEMSFLFSVTTAAASASTLEDALHNVVQELIDALNARSVAIYLPVELVNEQTNEKMIVMQPVALTGSGQRLDDLSEVRIDDNANLIGIVADKRRPTIINNIDAEPRYLPIVADARSAVIVPLTSGAQLIGLVVMEAARANAYNSETLTLLLTLSGTLSAIVQNQQLLEKVQETNEQLRELDRLKSDFLANMSHELRTPLNSIIGFSRVILKGIDGPLTEMQEQDLSTIYNSGQHLLNLINDILDQAKIANERLDLHPDYFDIKSVIDGVKSIGIGLVKDKPIDIFVELDSGLPQAYGDEFRTRQVLLNLVSNAAKFTREGSITITVRPFTESETGRTMLHVAVTDTGIGIAEKDMPLLFEAFRQVDSSLTRTVGGTGLGLPIARALVEMQGGAMFVESQLNVGSTFSITIPTGPPADEPTTDAPETGERKPKTGSLVTGTLNPAVADEYTRRQRRDETRETRPGNGRQGNGKHDTTVPPTRSTATQETAPHALAAKRQLLIIEENPEMLDQIRRALQGISYDVFAASIPLEAEAMASGLHPNIIIMDVNFTNGAGWEILKKLKSREDTRDIPVIINTLDSNVDKILAAGAHSHIQRPFDPNDLLAAVHAAEEEAEMERILIIDDQPESVRLLTELLEAHGNYRIYTARNGVEGIAQVALHRPHLILLDLRMPELDGFSVAEELRANPETANIPILVVTADTLNSEEMQRLADLNIIYKADISSNAYQSFLDGVKTYLARANGE